MQIKNRIASFQEEMTSWRHHFHENPELAYKEINTSKKVVELLKSFGINNIEEGIGKTYAWINEQVEKQNNEQNN